MSRRSLKVLVVVGLVLLMATMASAATPTNPSWMRYSPPQSFYMGFDAVGSYQYYDDQFNDDRDNVNHGMLKLRYWMFMDSPQFGYDVNAALTLQTKGVGADSEKTVNLDLNSGGHSSLKYYITPGSDLFAHVGVTGSSADLDRFSLVGNAGVGYGRFKDVTPLGRAAEMERALMEIGDVSQAFGSEFLVALAQETERMQSAEETRAQKTERIAAFIVAHAPGKPALSPRGVLAVDELLNKSVLRRSVGWEARVGVGYPLIVPKEEERLAQAVASMSLGMPIAFGTQVNLSIQATSPLEGLAKTYMLGVQGEAVHTVNSNLDVGASLAVNYSNEKEENVYSWSVGAFADLQILKSLTLVTTVKYSDATVRPGIWEQSTLGFTTSLRYRFF